MQGIRIATIMATLALAAALAASVLLLFVPFYEGAMTDPVTHGSIRATATLIEMNGFRVLIPLAIPPALAAAGLASIAGAGVHSRKLAWLFALLLVVFTFISGFSIGKFYTPAAGLSLAAAILEKSQRGKD